MDAASFRTTIEDEEMRTQLDRLGSSKLLVGLTAGDLAREQVLELAANSEYAARETFAGWADDEEDPAARAAFESLAEQEADHYERVLDLFDDAFEPADGGVMHAYLRGREGAIERVAAGMVGRSLYSVRAYTQIISFFSNEAEVATANVFRELKRDTQTTCERGCELLEALCEDEDDWDRATAAARYVIQLVYDDYADSLSALGLEVKSVC
jgi:rubrerythrin